MKEITIKLYSFEELSDEAKKRSLEDWNKDNEVPFLSDILREYIHEELKEKGYKVLGFSTSDFPSIRPFYSLGHSQGDGLMFEGIVEDKKGNVYTIKHSGRYYHEYSKIMHGVDKNGKDVDCKKFDENVYMPICREVATRGYQEIEYQESEEYFAETCEANEYTFEENGTMHNV